MAKQHDLRNEANAQYYFDEIKLWHDARPHHTVGVIVEAKSDEILFRKLLYSRTTFFAADGRWLNHSKNLGLTFKVLSNNKFKFIDYEDFIDEKTLKVDLFKLLKTVENKSQKQNFFKNNPNLRKEWEDLQTNSFDLKQLCNGHDLVNILSIALMNLIGNRKSSAKIAAETLEEGLILAYRLEDFVKTQLFEALNIWEKEHSPFKVHRI